MSLHWRKRLGHWLFVVRTFSNEEPWHRRVQALFFAAFKMLRALASGPVPAHVWRHRIRTCSKCPVRSENDWICFRRMADGHALGCRCSLPFLCLTAAPGKRGCFAREIVDDEGWENFVYPTLRAKLAATWRFLFP